MQQQIKIIEVYFAAKSVLLTQRQCREDFGRNNVPEGRINFGRQKVWWPQRLTLFILRHNSWEYSEFMGMPWRIPRKSTCCLSQETGILRKSFLRILHDDLKLFPYKIQILQRQTDQNKAEWETFCKDIIQRIENDPSLLDLDDLNDVDHCGLCAASATFAVSPNLATKCWIDLLSGTLFLPKSLLHCRCVRRTDFVAKCDSTIFICCCVVNRPVRSILVSKEPPRPTV